MLGRRRKNNEFPPQNRICAAGPEQVANNADQEVEQRFFQQVTTNKAQK